MIYDCMSGYESTVAIKSYRRIMSCRLASEFFCHIRVGSRRLRTSQG